MCKGILDCVSKNFTCVRIYLDGFSSDRGVRMFKKVNSVANKLGVANRIASFTYIFKRRKTVRKIYVYPLYKIVQELFNV